jgi:hypothetical protein
MSKVTRPRKIRWLWYVAHMKAIKIAYKILFGKFEKERPLRRNISRWEDNIEKDKVFRCAVDSSGLGKGPVEDSCEHSTRP